MVHKTISRTKAILASKLARIMENEADSDTLSEKQALAKAEDAIALSEAADVLRNQARLDDLHVWIDPNPRTIKTGMKNYPRWIATWRVGSKKIQAYIGSLTKMDYNAAMQKAQAMKAASLGIENIVDSTKNTLGSLIEHAAVEQKTNEISTWGHNIVQNIRMVLSEWRKLLSDGRDIRNIHLEHIHLRD
jgi:hypothetical protein